MDQPNPIVLRGVRGWLLFFVVTLIFLSPLFHIGITYAELSIYQEGSYPRLFPLALSIDLLMRVALLPFSIYAGIQLWKENPKAPAIAKNYLICVGVQQAVLLLLAFWVPTQSPMGGEYSEYAVAAIKQAVRGAGYACIWYLYLEKSERVRRTYLQSTPL